MKQNRRILSAILLIGLGCGHDDPVGTVTDSGTTMVDPPPECCLENACLAGQSCGVCVYDTTDVGHEFCDYGGVNCGESGYVDWEVEQCPSPVDTTGGPPTYSGWDPCSSIDEIASGSYRIDADLISEIRDDAGVLYYEDSARLRRRPTGHYVLREADSDDLASCLGLHNGDLIKSVNDHDLLTWKHYVLALIALRNETEFEVEIENLKTGGSSTMCYEIVN